MNKMMQWNSFYQDKFREIVTNPAEAYVYGVKTFRENKDKIMIIMYYSLGNKPILV